MSAMPKKWEDRAEEMRHLWPAFVTMPSGLPSRDIVAYMQAEIAELRSAFASRQSVAVPAGWALVPTKITEEMVVEFCEVWYSTVRAFDDPEMDDAYAAMLAAAPQPPAVKEVEPKGEVALLIAEIRCAKSLAFRDLLVEKLIVACEAGSARQDVAADPLDTPLPCDIAIGSGTIKKGCPLRTLVAKIKVLHGLAMESPLAQRATQVELVAPGTGHVHLREKSTPIPPPPEPPPMRRVRDGLETAESKAATKAWQERHVKFMDSSTRDHAAPCSICNGSLTTFGKRCECAATAGGKQ